MSDSTNNEIRVLVADGSSSTAAAVAAIIDSAPGMASCGQANRPHDAARLISSCQPDVVLLDPEDGADQWMQHLEETEDSSGHHASLVFFTTKNRRPPKTWTRQVDAVLFKGCGAEELTQTIREVTQRVID